tara:strand:+ start:33 stop:314 length:282 start_codon:yes stop_codon:yes gene_type:complete
MNKADKSEFDVIHTKIDVIKSDIDELKNSMAIAHDKTDVNLKFIKENMFNPHEGLWAETKLNSQFRENTTKWRGVIGVGFMGLIIDKFWSVFN